MRRTYLLAGLTAAAAGAVVVAACKPTTPDVPVAPRLTPTYSTNWTAAQREQFYHLAEGSEVIPVNMVKALINPITGRPIMADPERFGLIYDANNPDSLPVGVTDAETVDTRLLGIRMMGFNCAACHVNQLQYQGQALQMDGAPAFFNSDSLSAELQGAIKWTISSPIRIIEYLIRLRRIEKENPFIDTEADSGATQRVLEQLQPANLARAAGDSSHANFLRRLHSTIQAEAAKPGVDQSIGLGGPDNEAADQALHARYRDGDADDIADEVVGDRAEGDNLLEAVGTDARKAEADLEHFVEDLVVSVRLLIDRLETIKNIAMPTGGGAPSLPHTVPGAGRVDAFNTARNLIYVNDKIAAQGPVSFPWLWNFPNTVWLHYDANTNSVMERNLGQALGVGAVWDRYTAQSTLNPINIHALEQLARSTQPPAWPAMFGVIDSVRFRRGEAIYDSTCAGCHYNGKGSAGQPFVPWDRVYDLGFIRTDTIRATSFAIPVTDSSIIAGKPSPPLSPAPTFTDLVAPLLMRLKEQAYRTFNVPLLTQQVMNGCPGDSVWRTTRAYGARPLAGVWATAPYLHNGSVPTLHDLLLPDSMRPDSFIVGNREYDPGKLGYVTAVVPGQLGAFMFRTDSVGNYNGGHEGPEYGTTLSEQDRMAVLEYLKGHTLPTATGCPSGPAPPFQRVSSWPPPR